MNQMEIFKNPEFGSIRTFEQDGKVLFCGTDVATALGYVTHSGEGEGLLFYGSTILPFVDHFPKNTELYRIMTTKPQEMKEADGR